MSVPRLGSASIVMAYNDDDGFTVHHGSDGDLLASIPPERCDGSEWKELWALINSLVFERNGFRLSKENDHA